MIIGISTCIDYSRKIFNVLRMIKDAGFSNLEIWASGSEKYGRRTHFDFESPEEVNDLVKELERLNLNVISLHAPFFEDLLDISNPDEERRIFSVNAVKKAIEVLHSLGGKICVLHPCSTPYVSKKEDEIEKERKVRFIQAKKSINEIFELILSKNLKLALENQLPHIFGAEPETLYELIKDLDCDHIGFCFDISHATFFKNRTLYDVLKSLLPKMITTHISDSDRVKDEHRILGAGNINWKEVIMQLKENNYTGAFILEILKLPEDKTLFEILSYLHNFVGDLFRS